MSPRLPYTVEDVVAQSVAAAQAGAAVIHLHARDPKDGSPTADPAVFLEYLKAIKAETDAVISITSISMRLTMATNRAAMAQSRVRSRRRPAVGGLRAAKQRSASGRVADVPSSPTLAARRASC